MCTRSAIFLRSLILFSINPLTARCGTTNGDKKLQSYDLTVLALARI